MGVAYGGFIALAPAVAAGLFGTVGLGAILGALYTSAAIGGLVGPPVVGAVIDHVSYAAGITLAMVLTAASTLSCCSCCRPATTGRAVTIPGPHPTDRRAVASAAIEVEPDRPRRVRR